mgnify:CR=1 FL=1
MKLNPRFSLEEYVPKSVFQEHGERAIRFISTALIEADYQLLQDLEKHYGREISCSINTWSFGGNRNYSGLRVQGEPYYREHSLHSMGSASDKIFTFKDTNVRVDNKAIYDFIIDNQAKYYALGIRRMEDIRDASTWLHWDCCYTTEAYSGKIQIVRA